MPLRAPKGRYRRLCGSYIPITRSSRSEFLLGITDHAYTEVTAILKGDLKEGQDVIIRSWWLKVKLSAGSAVKDRASDSIELHGSHQPNRSLHRRPSGNSVVIVVEEVHKYYDLGETRVHALRGVSVEVSARRVRRDQWGPAAVANRRS